MARQAAGRDARNAEVDQCDAVDLTAGQQEQGHGLMEPLLYAPLVPVAAPVVKWAIEVTRLADLPLSGLILILRPLLGSLADTAAAVALPLLLLFSVFLLLRGHDAVGVGAGEEFDRVASSQTGTELVRIMAKSPLRDVDLEAPSVRSPVREPEF